MAETTEYRIVVLGGGDVGKSSLIAQFVQGVCPDIYDPTIQDSYRKEIEVEGRPCVLEITDTAGADQYSDIRKLSIKAGQGFLLVYSITSSSSLNEVCELRDQIIGIKNDDRVPLVLVGNKTDREKDREVSIDIDVGADWKVPRLQISAREQKDVNVVFRSLCKLLREKENSNAEEKEIESPQGKRNLVDLSRRLLKKVSALFGQRTPKK